MTEERIPSRQTLFIVPLLLLAFALRVYGLEHHNIWGDEAFSIALGKQPLAQIFDPGSETLPPLYHVLMHFWLRMAGDSIFAVRYLSVIPSMLLIPLVHVIGHRLLGRPGASLAAILATLSSFAIYYSQEARMYAWVTALSTLSVYALLRMHRQSSPRTSWSAAFLVSTVAAAFTHYYAFLILLAENLFMVWQKHRQRGWFRVWLGIQAIVGLVFLPWALSHAAFISGKANSRLDAWGLVGTNQVWAGTLWAFGIGTTVSSQQQWLAAALLILVMIGVRHTWKLPGPQRFLALYLFVPIAGAWLVGPLMPFFYQRYLTVALPAYLLLLAAGLIASSRPVLVGGLLLAVVANGMSLSNYYANPSYAKGGYGDLIAYVEQHSQSSDGLLLQNGAQVNLYDYYGPLDITAYNLPPWDNSERQPMLETIIDNHPRMWLLMYGDPIGYDPDHEMERWISGRAFRAYHGDYVDGSLDLYVQDEMMPTIPLEVNFGGMITLTGYALSDHSVVAGDSLQLTLSWLALVEMSRDYTIFAHLIDSREKPWAMLDSQPLGGTHPTSAWAAGEAVVDRIALQLDADAPAGDYRIQMGWYDLASMKRVAAEGDSDLVLVDRVLLGPIHVTER